MKRANPFNTNIYTNNDNTFSSLKRKCIENSTQLPKLSHEFFSFESVLQNQLTNFNFQTFSNQWHFIILYSKEFAFAYSKELVELSNFIQKNSNLIATPNLDYKSHSFSQQNNTNKYNIVATSSDSKYNIIALSSDSKYVLLACSQADEVCGMNSKVNFPLLSDMRQIFLKELQNSIPNVELSYRYCIIIDPNSNIHRVSIDSTESLLQSYATFVNIVQSEEKEN